MDRATRLKIDEEVAFQNLLTKLEDAPTYTMVCTVGRGGLSVLQKVAYTLDIKNILVLDSQLDLATLKTLDEDRLLFVDDIECTSRTLSLVPENVDTAVLVQRYNSLCLADYIGIDVATKEYISFSWEKDYE